MHPCIEEEMQRATPQLITRLHNQVNTAETRRLKAQAQQQKFSHFRALHKRLNARVGEA